MRIALLGSGKTGSHVLSLTKTSVTVFNSSNKPTIEALKNHDVVISFLPGEIFLSYVDILIESGIPVVTGATGFNWSNDLKNKLKEHNVSWVWGSNFSLGMNIVKNMIRELSKACELFEEYDFHIHEEHHTKKLDAPSGTALSWKAWLKDNAADVLKNNNKEIGMSYDRKGDIVGFHEVTLSTPDEEIKLAHTAKDRSLFARGALWAATKVTNNVNFPKGLTVFSDLVQNNLEELLQYRGNDER